MVFVSKILHHSRPVLRRLVMSNGGQYYARDKSSSCWPYRGLIPLVSHHYIIFGRKKTWFRWKTYLCLPKWSIRPVSSSFLTEFEISPLKSDFYRPTLFPLEFPEPLTPPPHHPFGIFNSLCDGVWIFSGTTHYALVVAYHYIIFFLQMERNFSRKGLYCGHWHAT